MILGVSSVGISPGLPDTDRVPPKLAASKAETVLLNTA